MTEKRTCIVTGGGKGIGRGIAEEFGTHNRNVVVNYYSSKEGAMEVVDEIETAGGSAIAVQADVTDIEQVRTVRKRAIETFGSVDVLVNNAGITVDGKFSEMSPKDWQRVIDVNLNGAFNCTKTFYEDVQQAEEGRIVNISSVVGKQGNYGQVNYAAAKSALFGFTRSLALELAPSGTTANCVAPGYTRTEMVEEIRDDIKDRIKEDIPLQRFGTIDEIAAVVCFLVDKDARYVTGEVLDVNGGIDL